MTLVSFEHQDLYEFAEVFADQVAEQNARWVTTVPDEHRINFRDPRIARLFQAFAERQPCVLPYPLAQTDSWLITGVDRTALDTALTHMSRFIIPSYAAFASELSRSQMLRFEPDESRLQQLGARLNLPGYYRWESPPSNRDVILDRLSLWLNLTNRRPYYRRAEQPTYADLEEDFRAALALRDWSRAESSITALRRLNITSAENLVFLEIILAAHKQDWSAIWNRADYGLIAQLRLPRAVKSAMLRAAHQVTLRPLEESNDWDAALRAFESIQPRLGRLLVSRAGLQTDAVLGIFSYLAVTSGDVRLMEELRSLAVSESSRRLLEVLAPSLSASNQRSPPSTNLETVFRDALAAADVDLAFQVAQEASDPVRRVGLLFEVTVQSRDEFHAREALRQLRALEEADIQRLERSHPLLDELVARSQSLLEIPNGAEELEAAATAPTIVSWTDWFEAALNDPLAPYLVDVLDQLHAQYDEREWPNSELEKLFYCLVNLHDSSGVAKLAHIDRALTKLTDVMMRDESFPRMDGFHQDIYRQLFDVLLTAGSAEPARATRITDLAAAVLENRPEQIDEIAVQLATWYERPVPRLEEQALATVEVLADFGVTPGVLAVWYRRWAEYLLTLPTKRDTTDIAVWRSLGMWTGASADIIANFDRLVAEESTDSPSPIAALEPGFCIVIFTLRRSSASRVQDVLLELNAKLDVRICLEKDLSARARDLARRADLPVIVTSCITHSLTYGIAPHLETEPIYPPSSGSAGILRAIEQAIFDPL